MIPEMYCRNCDRHTRHTFTGNFKDGIRLLGRYVCNDCGTEQEDEPRGAEEVMLVEELRRLAVDVQQQKNRVVEAVWRAIVGNDTPKKEDGELTVQGPYGPETRYYFRYKGQDVAVLTIKEIELGRFSFFIQSESITPWGVMEQLKKIELGAGK